ncbi:MAG: hypothetical protein ACRDJE_25855, partial [Dehalococcoidia bacterium]
ALQPLVERDRLDDGTAGPDVGGKPRRYTMATSAKHPVVTAFIVGWGIGTYIDNELGLSDHLANWLFGITHKAK